ncbi:hypothetical protein [Pedobacter aquatilis]|uniref:hypothetical protein n=1 Tax=Pedobacter aquatilis TaxID=351343 RepID=UPI00292E661B|nr:hypothetical protein [Pedobacter aquatilis]
MLDKICGKRILAFAEMGKSENRIISVVMSSEVQRSREIFFVRLKDFSATVEMTDKIDCFIVPPRNDDVVGRIAGMALVIAKLGLCELKQSGSRFVISSEVQRSREIFLVWFKDFSTTVEMTVSKDCFVVPPRNDDIVGRIAGMALVIAKLGLCELKQSGSRFVIPSKVQRSRETFFVRFKDFFATVEMTVSKDCFVVPPRNDDIVGRIAGMALVIAKLGLCELKQSNLSDEIASSCLLAMTT